MKNGLLTGNGVAGSLSGRRSPWAALAFALLAILLLNLDTATRIVSIWIRSQTFAHGFLVPPIVGWLIWRRRALLAAVSPKPSPVVWPFAALAAFAWLLGDLTSTNAITFLALAAMLVLAVPAILGISSARTIAFPLAYFFFAVPVGEFVIPQMMEWTADFTTQALVLTGIPVYREGMHFVIPSGNWAVEEACSGVRYLIASVVVGSLYAYLSYHSLRKRLVFIAMSFVVPVVANWLRAYMIVMLGHLSGNRLAVGVDHIIYGWIFFGIVIIIMFIVGARWADSPESLEAPPIERKDNDTARPSAWFWGGALVVVAIASAPHLWRLAIEQSEARRDGLSARLALGQLNGWQQVTTTEYGWQPAFSKPAAYIRNEYVRGEQRVGLYVAYYFNQTYESKLISSSNALVKTSDEEWARVADGRRQTVVGDHSLAVRTAELRGARDRRLIVWQWYWIRGHLTSSDYLAKAYQALSRLVGSGDDSAVVVLYVPKDVAGGADAALQSFIAEAGPALDKALWQAVQPGR